MPETVYRQAFAAETAAAMRVLCWEPGVAGDDLDEHARTLAARAEAGNLDVSCLFVAVVDDEVAGAALTVSSPGRVCLAFPPRTSRPGVDAGRLLTGSLDLTRRRGSAWAQALVPTDAAGDRRLLTDHGFEYLTDLVYMQRRASSPSVDVPDPVGLTWRTYSLDTHAAFASVIERTYEQTHDCPRLNGTRPVSDVIAGHKADGVFTPACWLLACESGGAVGCMLGNPVPETASLEISYMGVVPEARGRSLGKTLCAKAIRLACQRNIAYVTLAMDCQNGPGRSVYEAMGFRSVTRRAVFLLTL